MIFYQFTMITTAEKICVKFSWKIKKEKLKVVRLKFAIVCEKALGDICKVTLLHESMLRTT